MSQDFFSFQNFFKVFMDCLILDLCAAFSVFDMDLLLLISLIVIMLVLQ